MGGDQNPTLGAQPVLQQRVVEVLTIEYVQPQRRLVQEVVDLLLDGRVAVRREAVVPVEVDVQGVECHGDDLGGAEAKGVDVEVTGVAHGEHDGSQRR